MPAPSSFISGVITSVPLMSQDNGNSIVPFLWVELIATKWMRDQFFDLSTYESVINMESNNWKENKEKTEIGWGMFSFCHHVLILGPQIILGITTCICLFVFPNNVWLKNFEGGKQASQKMRQNFICLTNSWDCGQNPASELACALCISSVVLRIFQRKVPNEKKEKKFFLGKCQKFLNVMTRDSCVNDPNISICSHQWDSFSTILSLACPPVAGVLG